VRVFNGWWSISATNRFSKRKREPHGFIFAVEACGRWSFWTLLGAAKRPVFGRYVPPIKRRWANRNRGFQIVVFMDTSVTHIRSGLEDKQGNNRGDAWGASPCFGNFSHRRVNSRREKLGRVSRRAMGGKLGRTLLSGYGSAGLAVA
jgi:hypothetical protein